MCALTWAPLAWSAPPNDAFANAQTVDGGAGAVPGTNIDATVEPDEPSHAGPGGASVWYRWTAPATGTGTFDVCGPETDFDTLLAVYTGTTVDKLDAWRSDDDGCGGIRSTVSFQAQVGVSYSIRVDGFFGEEGNFVLRWRLPPSGRGNPRISGEPEQGVRLTTTGPSWSGIEPIQLSHEWQRCHPLPLVNAARGKPAFAEVFDPTHPPAHVVDGALDSYWTAGDFAPQAIDIDLRGPHPVGRIRLHVSQLPSGPTVHRVLARTERSSVYALQHTFSGLTSDGQVLEFDVPATAAEYRSIRIVTDNSPAWVGWREIEVLSRCGPTEIQSGDAYLLDSRDVGSTVRVVARAVNAGGEEATESGTTATIRAARLPVNTVPPEIIGDPRVGRKLLAFEGGWLTASPYTFALVWQRCAPGPRNCAQIANVTGSEYTVARRDAGSVLRIASTVTNAAGSVTAESAPTRVVPRPRAPVRLRCVVPRLRLKTVVAARRALARARCRLGRVRRAHSRVRRGRIISQSRRAGRRLPVGTRVNVVVSRGRR
jgi:hypothetical protein